MEIDPATEEAVRRFLDLIADHYEVAGAILYGSRARGTHRPDSDADLAVILAGERRLALPVALAMSDLAYDVLIETGIDISPMPVWLDEWDDPESASNPDLVRLIIQEGIRLL